MPDKGIVNVKNGENKINLILTQIVIMSLKR